MKRFLKMAAAVLLACMLVCFPSCADATESTSMDVILVLDLSGSMKYNDENHISQSGAKMFIDMMESTGSRAGLVAFSDELVETYSLTSLSTADDKTALKNVIDSLSYDGDTDIGTALETAVSMLTSATDVGNKKAIIFFTDGAIDLPNASAGESEAEAESLSKTQSAMTTAASSGIPIYTIGLNANGNADTELISEIASSTGATSDIVTSASELPEIFSNIFADFVESEINDLGNITISSADTYESVGFSIPNDSVLEANIVMITSSDTGKVTDILLTDPSGNTLSPDGSSIILTTDDNYSNIKLVGPSSGSWVLQIKGDAGCEVHVNLIYNYDIILVANVSDDGSGNMFVSATLQKNNAQVSDDALYAALTTTANVTRANGTVESYPMALSGSNFTCTVTSLDPQEVVTVTVHTEGANMYRDSDTLTFTNPTSVPEPDPNTVDLTASLPNPITLKGLIPSMAKTTLNLDSYFTSSAGLALTYSVQVADSEIATADLNGSSLTLKGAKKDTTSITVTATDTEGNTASQSTEVEVSATLNSILPLILIPILLLLIILIIVLLIVKSKGSKLTGFLFWQLLNEEGYSDSTYEEQFDLTFAKKTAQVSSFVTDLSLAYSGLDKVEISGNKNGITVQNKGKTCDLLDPNGAVVKKTTVFDGGFFRIVCRTDDGATVIVSIRYQKAMAMDGMMGDMNDFEF
ncbi:MAG: VWA domain-containing protein [Lachnospiraceae bacterium]|nr:VWA domain-containing protein [Lachnospiraceae bacterium]